LKYDLLLRILPIIQKIPENGVISLILRMDLLPNSYHKALNIDEGQTQALYGNRPFVSGLHPPLRTEALLMQEI